MLENNKSDLCDFKLSKNTKEKWCIVKQISLNYIYILNLIFNCTYLAILFDEINNYNRWKGQIY